MKKIIPLFLLALAPLAASAQSVPSVPGTSTTPVMMNPMYFNYLPHGTSYTNGVTSGIQYADGSMFVANESVRVLALFAKADKIVSETKQYFELDLQGEPVLTADGEKSIAKCIWMRTTLDGNPTYASVGDSTTGVPGARDNEGFYVFGAYVAADDWPEESDEIDTTYCYVYLVTYDTRRYDATSEAWAVPAGEPAYISKWNAVYVAKREIANAPIQIAANFSLEGVSGTVFSFDIETPKPELSPAFSLTVGDAQDPLTGAELEDYLSPEIASATFTDPESVTLLSTAGEVVKTLQIQASSTDIVCYTLYTANSLDGEWKPFDTLLEEKGVDTADKKEYTRFRIDGESKTITIPVFDDATRFYQLRMDN